MEEEVKKRKRRTKQEIEADALAEAPEVDSPEEVVEPVSAPLSEGIPSEPVKKVRVQGQTVLVNEIIEDYVDGQVVHVYIKGADGQTYDGNSIVNGVLV
jgi:hypothetical protein